jgi:hypothetical protein
MILRASELTPAGYANGQGILFRTEPVPKYGEVLAATSSSHALSVTTHYIQDVFKCSVHIPASLATAIYYGQFRWPTMFTRGAFSIFSLPPASASGQLAFRSEEERVQLELEATEGKGISAAQAIATAKIHHSPILNPPALQDFLSNKLHINVLVFGQNSPLTTTFVHTWSRHTVSHRESYELFTDSGLSFCSRLGHIIDMAKQAYLCSCITAATTLDIDLSVLDHAALRTGIAMGMMPVVAIPASLASILITSPHPRSQAPALACDESPAKRQKPAKDAEHSRDKPKAREAPRERPTQVTQPTPPSWKAVVDNDNYFFSLNSSLQPLGASLQCPEPGLCGKLLLRGCCNSTGCPRESSHPLIQALDPTQIVAVDKWFNAACKEQKLL